MKSLFRLECMVAWFALFAGLGGIVSAQPAPPSGGPGLVPPQSSAPGQANGNVLPTFPAPGGPPSERQQNPAQPTGTPVPASGSDEAYSYAPSDHEGFSVVYPANDSEPLIVSTDFLNTSIKTAKDGAQVVGDAKAYQQMTGQIADQFAKQFYPDSSSGSADVPRSVIEGANRDVIIEQDPKAGPYARVTVTDKAGNIISESSVSAGMARQIAENPHMDVEKKISALESQQFTLPEKARQNFDKLSPEDFRAIVMENPALQKQEFVRFARVVAEEKAKQVGAGEGSDNAGISTTTASADKGISAEVANRAGRETDDDDVALEKLDVAHEPADVRERSESDANRSELRPESGLNGPEIAGIALGVVAIGIFIFGWWKTRR